MSLARWIAAGATAAVLTGCSAPSGTPSSALVVPSASAPAAVPSSSAPRPVVTGDGWSSADIPVFDPAPEPEKVITPEGDKVPWVLRVPTQQKVAFITIDDGYVKHKEAAALLRAANVPVTLFLTTNAVQDDPDYFKPLVDAGAVIEAHTISHPEMKGMSLSGQKHQICGSADKLESWYERRPVLFRPPYGDKDDTTLRAAKQCGMSAAFMWKETVDKGKVRYQGPKRVEAGDVVLMHFRDAFVADFLAALRAIHKAGLTPALLEDYVA